tara:strand:- start:600 stop:1235 length:636 start_codon:yes stop_codon:yes gene_type:complete
MRKISILNYGCGNLLSLERAVREVEHDVRIISKVKDIENSDFIILPGVGAFKNAIDLLNTQKFVEPLKIFVKEKKKPILGICLGMQLFFSKSYEMGEHNGLNFIPGEVVSIKKFSKINDIKIPQINWNKIKITDNYEKKIISEELNGKSFYFIHSYMAKIKNQKNLISFCSYYDLIVPAIVKSENVLGCQFHPEKSGKNGLKLLKNILNNL